MEQRVFFFVINVYSNIKCMTTEDMVERLIELAYAKYKKLSLGCPEHDKLMKKEPVEIEGTVFRGFREYACYRISEFIRKEIPEATVELVLDGMDSTITIEMDDRENQEINRKMYLLIKRWVE